MKLRIRLAAAVVGVVAAMAAGTGMAHAAPAATSSGCTFNGAIARVDGTAVQGWAQNLNNASETMQIVITFYNHSTSSAYNLSTGAAPSFAFNTSILPAGFYELRAPIAYGTACSAQWLSYAPGVSSYFAK